MSRTVTNDTALLILRNGEEGRPFGKIVEVEVDVVVLGKRIKVCQVHAKEILGFELSKRSHCYDKLSKNGLI